MTGAELVFPQYRLALGGIVEVLELVGDLLDVELLAGELAQPRDRHLAVDPLAQLGLEVLERLVVAEADAHLELGVGGLTLQDERLELAALDQLGLDGLAQLGRQAGEESRARDAERGGR